MGEIKRSDVSEEWAHSGIVEAGDFVFINYCVGVNGWLCKNCNGLCNNVLAL